VLENPRNPQNQRLRAACALATYAPDDPRWQQVSADVAARLVVQDAFVLGKWAEALQPAGPWLLPALLALLQDDKRSAAERRVSATLCKIFAAGQARAFVSLEKVLTQPYPEGSWDDAKLALVKRQANVGAALVAMGQGDKVWPLLKHNPDPTLRSYLIDRLATSGVDPGDLMTHFEAEPEVSIKRALLLSLGEFGVDRLSQVERDALQPRLLQVYEDDPDPGLHGAADWLLRQWGAEASLQQIDKKLQRRDPDEQRGWYVNGQGQTLVLIPKSGEFWMGEGQWRRKESINYRYALGSKEVTVAQFGKFRRDQRQFKQTSPTPDCPMTELSWHDAAAYCNWVSEKEGIPKDQWYYEPGPKEGEMNTAANHLHRTGYRLATEAEWEYACRAGAQTGYGYGEPDELLGKYAWFVTNSMTRCHPVGLLKPNDMGLFDMHGNAWEWCDDRYDQVTPRRARRGGGLIDSSWMCRAATRRPDGPSIRFSSLGLRLARVPAGVKDK
jgi:formylglycine-generating enzyme required for sulfatase activity